MTTYLGFRDSIKIYISLKLVIFGYTNSFYPNRLSIFIRYNLSNHLRNRKSQYFVQNAEKEHMMKIDAIIADIKLNKIHTKKK